MTRQKNAALLAHSKEVSCRMTENIQVDCVPSCQPGSGRQAEFVLISDSLGTESTNRTRRTYSEKLPAPLAKIFEHGSYMIS